MERVTHNGARVILIDEQGRTLLFEGSVPGAEATDHVWVTPGGGVAAGESIEDAARREVREETGLVIDLDALGAPVAVTRGDWYTEDHVIEDVTTFFHVRVENFVPDHGAQPPGAGDVTGNRWWSPDEIDETGAPVYPGELPQLVRRLHKGAIPAQPLELDWC